MRTCFDEIDHTALMGRVRHRVGDMRVLGLVKAFLEAGILTGDGAETDKITGTPQGESSPRCSPMWLCPSSDALQERTHGCCSPGPPEDQRRPPPPPRPPGPLPRARHRAHAGAPRRPGRGPPAWTRRSAAQSAEATSRPSATTRPCSASTPAHAFGTSRREDRPGEGRWRRTIGWSRRSRPNRATAPHVPAGQGD